MIVKCRKHSKTQRQSSQIHINSVNPQNNNNHVNEKSDHLMTQNTQRLTENITDSTLTTESLQLKSSRLKNVTFLRKQSRKFKSVKCPIRKNSDFHQFKEDQQHMNQQEIFKKTDHTSNKTFLRQTFQKNSMMNRIITEQKKASNLNYLKNSIFQCLKNHQQHQSLNLNEQLKATNEKMIALLSQRPFPRKLSFGIQFGKLKMGNKNMKQLLRKNSNIKESMSFHQSVDKSYQKRHVNHEQNLMSLSRLKKHSIDSSQKSSIKNDEFQKTFMKMQPLNEKKNRYSQLRDHQNTKNKNSLLTISDDQNDNIGSLGVSIEIKLNKNVRTSQDQNCQQKTKIQQANKLKKCQQKIMNDLIKLQKIRNDKIVFIRENRNNNQLKPTKSNGLHCVYAKNMATAEKNEQTKKRKSKYVVKFKTQPNQSPLQKLKTRIGYEIKDDQCKRKLSKRKEFSQISEVYGFAKSFERKNLTDVSHYVKDEKDKKVRLESINQKINYLQKQLSGWDIAKQTDVKQNWSANIF